MTTPSRNTPSQPSSAGQTAKNSRGKGIGRGTGRGGARTGTYMPLQRMSNLSAVRPPRQQPSASTGGRTNPIVDYIPQPVADQSPHFNDTNMDAQPERDNEVWDIDVLFGELHQQDEDNGENGDDEAVPDSQIPGGLERGNSRVTSNDPQIDTAAQIPISPAPNTSESGLRQQRPILRGGSSTGGGVNENEPIEDDRPFVIPAGDDSFDPSACVKRIGMECIGAHFKVGWTTMETCDPDAPEIWFQHFKTIVKWDPIYTHQIKANFRRKCSKIISDAWYSMRRRKSKGPKWATPDQREWARKKFLTDPLLAARSARNKINYRGQKSGRGPSVHTLGPNPMTFHLLLMKKKYKRQILPNDMYIKAKQRKDGTFVTPDAKEKLKDLDDAIKIVRSNNKDAAILPEGELMDATGEVMGFSSRSGLPNLYGATATLEPSSQWSCNRSMPSVPSQRPHEAPVEEIVEIVEERIRPALSQMQERIEAQPQQLDTRLSRIEETNSNLAEQMRLIIQLLQNNSRGPSNNDPHSQPNRHNT